MNLYFEFDNKNNTQNAIAPQSGQAHRRGQASEERRQVRNLTRDRVHAQRQLARLFD